MTTTTKKHIGRKKLIHYAVDDHDVPDMIFSACGIPLCTRDYFSTFAQKIKTKRGHRFTMLKPAKINCKLCMKTKAWKERLAKDFANRMKK